MRQVFRIFWWLVASIAFLVIVVFVVVNIETVTVSLDPLPWRAEMPLAAAIGAGVAFGLALGAILVWLGGHKGRQRSAERRRRIKELERQLAAAERKAAEAQQALPPQPPPAQITGGSRDAA